MTRREFLKNMARAGVLAGLALICGKRVFAGRRQPCPRAGNAAAPTADCADCGARRHCPQAAG